MTRNMLFLVFACLLTACERKHHDIFTVNGDLPASSGIYLMMGQSNLANMPDDYLSEPLSRMNAMPIVSNVASGGSAISEWQKGQPFYERALSRYRELSGRGRLAGIFFWQGEKEGVLGPQADAQTWAMEFTRLVRDFRQDTGVHDLRVVFMQVGILDSYPYAADIKSQQASVSLPNVIMVTTDGYPVDSDGHHFSNHYRELGERMAVAMAIE